MSKSTRKQLDEILEDLINSYFETENSYSISFRMKIKDLLDDLEEEAFTRGIQGEDWYA